MEIINIKNGHMIYDGKKYYVLNDWYGLCAYSESINRDGDKVSIDMIKADLMPYDTSYITRCIKKCESQFINKAVTIFYTDEVQGVGGYGNIRKKYIQLDMNDR